MTPKEKTTAAERLAEIVAWADNRRRYIEADERFYGPRATTFENEILAMIQVDLRTEHRALCAVLSMAEFRFVPTKAHEGAVHSKESWKP